MKSILIIHHGQGVGGGLVALLGLINGLRKEYEVSVLAIFDGVAVDYLRANGVNVYIAKTRFYKKYYNIFIHSEASNFTILDFIKDGWSFFLFFLSKYFFAERELVSLQCQFDIVYLNSTFISDWARAARKLSMKVVIHIREPLAQGIFGNRRIILRRTIQRYCNKIIAITYDNAKRVDLMNKTSVVYDPVLVNRCLNEKSITQDQSCEMKYFTYVGGTYQIKGFEQLVKALPYLAEDVRIFFLGGQYQFPKYGIKWLMRYLFDPYVRKYNKLFQLLINSDKIVYVGLADNVFDYYNTSVAVISCFSKPHASLPVLEAFSISKPVIVTDVDGMNEITGKEYHFYTKNGDATSLAMRINEMAAISEKDYQNLCIFVHKRYLEIRRLEEKISVSSIIRELITASPNV